MQLALCTIYCRLSVQALVQVQACKCVAPAVGVAEAVGETVVVQMTMEEGKELRAGHERVLHIGRHLSLPLHLLACLKRHSSRGCWQRSSSRGAMHGPAGSSAGNVFVPSGHHMVCRVLSNVGWPNLRHAAGLLM